MTTLTKIRNRAGLLVGIIAFALFAFVMGDLFRSGFNIFKDDPRLVGEVAGKQLMLPEFESLLDEALKNEKMNRQGANLSESDVDQVRENTWNLFVYESIMNVQYANLGIGVSGTELQDMVVGKDPHPDIVRAFTDPKTGQFNPQAVVQFMKNMDNDKTGETKQRWLAFERDLKRRRIANKYLSMVKGGLYVTKSQAKRQYAEEGRSAKVKVVIQRYADIADSTIKVTDADLNNYYNQNKHRYKQDRNLRGVEFVMFESIPSDEDRNDAVASLEALKAEFTTTKEDTNFISVNSDNPNIRMAKKGDLGPALDSTLFVSAPGTVYGPYFEGNSVRLAKNISVSMEADSGSCRHILIPYAGAMSAPENVKRTKDQAKSMSDSLLAVLKKSTKDFEMMVTLYSTDEGSKAKGGKYEWFKAGQMQRPFEKAVLAGKKGDLTIAETPYGFHIIEVLATSASSKRVLVGFIDRELRPSKKTYEKYYAQASEFGGKNNTAEKFDEAVKSGNLTKRIADNIKETDRNLPGVEGARELVKWAFSANKGDVSQVYEFNGKFVIAKLTSIKDKGVLPLEAVKTEVENEAKKEKKAEILIKKMEAARSAGNIDAIAGKLNARVEPIENVTFAAGYFPNVGREPELNAQAFTLGKNKLSAPIKGENGVYFMIVEDIKEPTATNDYKNQLNQLAQQLKGRVDYEVFESLKDKTDIKDNRIKFY